MDPSRVFKVYLHGLEIDSLNIIGFSFDGGFSATKFAVEVREN
jgi:hypothetical protein